jgi:Predicted acyltransferases
LNQNQTEIKKNNEIFLIKALSVVSVVSAHCHTVPDGQGGFAWYSSLVLRNIGTTGVLCFFIVAGYLYHPEKYPLDDLIKKKAKTIVIPWFFTYFVFFYLVKHWRLTSVIKRMLGIESCMYYLTMLMFCYILFYSKTIRKKSICFALLISTVFSTIFFYDLPYRLRFLPMAYHSDDWIGYLNPINWIGYFAIGILAQTEFEKIKPWLYHRITLPLSFFIYACSIGYHLIIGLPATYFHGGVDFLIRLSGTTMVFCLAHRIEKNSYKPTIIQRTMVEVGKDSFSVYLLHLFALTLIEKVMNQPAALYFVLLRPFVIIAIIVTGDIMIRKIKYSSVRHIAFTLLGIR